MQKQLSEIESVIEMLAGELALCEAGTDQGLIPLYSLLTDLTELFGEEEPRGVQLCQPVVERLNQILDDAGVLLDADLIKLEQLILGLQTCVRFWLMDLEAPWQELLPRQDEENGDTPAVDPVLENSTPRENETIAGKKVNIAPEEEARPISAQDELLVLSLDENREILEEFYQEAADHLDSIEAALLELEEDPDNKDAISSIFRSFHTIKGVAGFLDLRPMQRLAHEVETLLDFVRNGKVSFTQALVSLVLESRDRLQLHLLQIQEGLANGVQPREIVPVSDLIGQTVSFLPVSGDTAIDEAVSGAGPDMEDQEADTVADAFFSAAISPASSPDTVAKSAGLAPSVPDLKAPTVTGKAKVTGTRATIRMDLLKLDSIIDAVGELVIVESQLRDSIQAFGDMDSRIERNLAQLGRITGELQRSGLSLRMVSLKSTFQKMQRLVRDLASKCGKQVNFVVEGEDTEMDRSVVEEISDPLVHMIRNSLDHGIEAPQQRLAVGKPQTGTLTLRAYYSGDSIVLELKDDGRGVNGERVLAKAIERGLAQPGQNYSREEIIAFLFHPGLSTAEKISDVSGRGVGMDVVKTNIQKLRGRIEMRSEEGKGSVVRMSLPLTMAIIDGLLVRIGTERFILPVSSVNMTLNPEPSQIFNVQGKGKVIKHREQIFRLVHLGEFFRLPESQRNDEEVVVMVESDDCQFGLIVDEVLGKQEVVVKHLGGFLHNPEGVSGGAILGDGTIALILDPGALGRVRR